MSPFQGMFTKRQNPIKADYYYGDREIGFDCGFLPNTIKSPE